MSHICVLLQFMDIRSSNKWRTDDDQTKSGKNVMEMLALLLEGYEVPFIA